MDAQATFSCSFTQSDLGPVAELPSLPDWPAQRLLPQQRQDLAVQVLAGAQPVSDLARDYEVSRKFLYQQADTAREALTQAFQPQPKDEEVLFYLPVTKAWLRQLVLALVLVCHAPYRAVVELFRDLLDWRIALGSVHNIVRPRRGTGSGHQWACQLGGRRRWSPRRDFPGPKAGARGCQHRLDLLLSAESGATSRCRHLGRSPARFGGSGLPASGDRRRCRHGSSRRSSRGPSPCPLPRRCVPHPHRSEEGGRLPGEPCLWRFRNHRTMRTPA